MNENHSFMEMLCGNIHCLHLSRHRPGLMTDSGGIGRRKMLPRCGAKGLVCSGDSLTPCWLRTSDMASHLILSLFERWSNWDLERLNVSKVIDLVHDTTQIQAHVPLFPLYIEILTLSVIMVLISYIQGTLPLALCFLFFIFSKEEWWRHTVLAAWMAELKRFKQYPQGCELLTWNWESASITSYNGWWQKMGRKEERLEMQGTTELLHSTEESLQRSAVPAASTVHWAPEDSGEHWVQPLPGPHRDCNTDFSLSTTGLWGALSTASLQGAAGIQTVFLIYHHYDKCLVSSP